ncbi:hypothetical protein Ae168Ps1_6376 [Pseudonocardia sp. Ae168_Ps1]|uniref:BrnT family toxin n=1 Tax=unclassified Pseudonocardia TaxID=2619320 RepID=UPI0009662818|nr:MULTISPECIES: BrnT family toxin [unclassified Pseudonocardia]OLL69881.1 hypothetical protein Ae150APs1_6191c [Pseudonocardia sp. Ae150A_Ps1]OLL70139.1 hypothetical protein Ae168Ps1_6376 [Pseudonocardia sp. Ae168_Ps1]OLL70410.1 hypothetical protein Ae263Ps1_6354 [Pseudonocardia sp. Ae263_Ps1]OLL89191.1 hypothetical protein Ae356Ps1_6219 [Pseudonocardia sp. Ae356_Ps1]
MWREIQWTEESEAHIARHSVAPGEVEQLVNTRPRYVVDGRESTTLIYGTTDDGRHLLVVTAASEDGRHYVVTARDMDDAERRAFVRKAR